MKAVSGKDFCKALERKGWVLQRVTGSHHVYANPLVPGIILPVPVHANHDLKTGLQRALMRKAGLGEAGL